MSWNIPTIGPPVFGPGVLLHIYLLPTIICCDIMNTLEGPSQSLTLSALPQIDNGYEYGLVLLAQNKYNISQGKIVKTKTSQPVLLRLEDVFTFGCHA